MTNVFKQSKCENISKLLDLTIKDDECDLRMDLDFNKTMKTHLNINNKARNENEIAFKKEIKKEISNTLKIDESLIVIGEIKAGSVIVSVFIVCGIIDDFGIRIKQSALCLFEFVAFP